METIRSGERKKLSSVAVSRDTQGGRRIFTCSWSDFSRAADMTYNTSPSHQVRKHDYCIILPCLEMASLYTVHDTNPGIPNKLLLLKVDCYTHNETSKQSRTHQASRNPIRTKTNIWSSKLSLHHHPSRHTLQFETLLDDWTNKSQHF